MKKFKNELFNELHGFMEKMDGSDDYLMIQVSVFNPGKDGMEMSIIITGRTDGKEVIMASAAETTLITAMRKNDDLRRLITNAAMHCKTYEEFLRRQKS